MSPKKVTHPVVGGKKLLFHPTTVHPLRTTSTNNAQNLRNGGDRSDHNGDKVGGGKANSRSDDGQSKSRIVTASTSWGGLDPLSAALQDSDDIPRNNQSSFASGSVKRLPSQSITNYVTSDYIDDNFRTWSSYKVPILKEYTTSERLSIKTSFLNGTGGDPVGGGNTISIRNLQSTSLAEKVKHRLEQLDDFEESSLKEVFDLTQQEYFNRIEVLNQALKDSWDSDQRVRALKIAIQCAKLLADVSVIQFYPSKFVLVTDILDNFGNLVYKRISCKADIKSTLESAQETCRNWFFKIASIRELIPRLYLESAILRTLSFIVDKKYVYVENCKALHRLTSMVRGIGDPLVATYARAYICRVAITITPQDKSFFHQNFSDFLLTHKQLESAFVCLSVSSQKVSFATYLTLYIPALNWILQCLTTKASESALMDILEEYKTFAKERGHVSVNALVLNSILITFDGSFIVERSSEFVDLVTSMISKGEERNNSPGIGQDGFPSHLLLRNLGNAFVSSPELWKGVEKKDKLLLMNNVWKKISKLKSSEHLSCASVWTDFAVKHLDMKEVNILLKDIVKHVQPDIMSEEHHAEVINIIKRVVQSLVLENFSTLFGLESFVPFLDILKKESVRVEACRIIVEAYLEKLREKSASSFTPDDQSEPSPEHLILDPVIISSLTFLCKTMHDSVNALTLDDDKRIISGLINQFISHVSFQRDFQSHLDFLVESRSNFSNLELVIAHLVNVVNRIAVETQQIVKGRPTKRVLTFIRACLAYSFITIPSLDDTVIKLQLYLSSAQVALLNGCLPQTDAFLRALMDTLSVASFQIEMHDGGTKSLEPYIISFVANLLSFLLIVPDHPEKETLYLFRNLFFIVKNLDLDPNADTRASLYLEMINYLCVAGHENYPYHIDRVDSNDTLYGHSSAFLDTIDGLRDEVVQEILSHLKILGERSLFKRQSMLALDCFFRLIVHGETRKVAKLAFNLWQLVLKNNSLDTRTMMKNINFVNQLGKISESEELIALSKKMNSLIA
ncbi:VPS35 endosomal protein-sorting factor-like [Brevipalpus obovatus]|uniref:VPS35 endosomal protein-sorting factor-like n=1 Tax=Brevipalpus obovatus TaxID=246614 RepID=UPI003D9F6449